ncbi:hypothetical protein CDD83_1270 [Cordyceps sp. RAO-2017]|nr:hypothetical protein CDD83_1270 [Cordyceps sp. RAO-2017]
MGSVHPATFQVRKIAVIGAGPGGLAAAKYLSAQGAFDQIVVFEQQHEVGGVWCYSRAPPGPCPVPQTDPFLGPDGPLRPPAAPPVFPSPMYDRLHANIVKPLMRFSDQAFPAASWIFPAREDIQDYLVRYARDVRPLIRFGYRVASVSLRRGPDGADAWRLRAEPVAGSGRAVDDVFDAVVVANGHYSVPYIPVVRGIAAFHGAHPSVIIHSKQYRAADRFRGKKVVVVGNGPSGIDIALQVNRVSGGRTLLSVRSATPPERLAHTGCEEVPEADEFLADVRGVRFKGGRVESGIDAVIFCTGFFFSYPFLADFPSELITSGRGVHGLYQHLFHLRHPTLAFSGLLVKSIPWPLSEAQAACLAAVWSNSLPLPPVEEMERWSRELYERNGEALHVLPPGGDYDYINGLHDWVMQASHLGKEPPRWNDESKWQRKNLPEAKIRFEELGCKATTLEELGFRYHPGRAA